MYLCAMDDKFGLIGAKKFRSNPTPSVDEAKEFLKSFWPSAEIYGPLEKVPVRYGPAHVSASEFGKVTVRPRIVSIYTSSRRDGVGRTMRNWIPLAVFNVLVSTLRDLAFKNHAPWDEYLPKAGVTFPREEGDK